MTPPPVWTPRPLQALAPWRVGPFHLKVYHIGAEAPGPALIAAARTEAARIIDAATAEGGAHGTGFAILHAGTAGTWLLLDWWAHGDILCQLLSLDEGEGFAAVDHRPLMACVWELQVIAHERDAWLRHMMGGRAAPEAYLADILPAGAV